MPKGSTTAAKRCTFSGLLYMHDYVKKLKQEIQPIRYHQQTPKNATRVEAHNKTGVLLTVATDEEKSVV